MVIMETQSGIEIPKTGLAELTAIPGTVLVISSFASLSTSHLQDCFLPFLTDCQETRMVDCRDPSGG